MLKAHIHDDGKGWERAKEARAFARSKGFHCYSDSRKIGVSVKLRMFLVNEEDRANALDVRKKFEELSDLESHRYTYSTSRGRRRNSVRTVRYIFIWDWRNRRKKRAPQRQEEDKQANVLFLTLLNEERQRKLRYRNSSSPPC